MVQYSLPKTSEFGNEEALEEVTRVHLELPYGRRQRLLCFRRINSLFVHHKPGHPFTVFVLQIGVH